MNHDSIRIVSVKTAAEILDMRPKTVKQMVADGRLKRAAGFPSGHGRAIRITYRSVVALIEGSDVVATPHRSPTGSGPASIPRLQQKGTPA